MLPGPAMDESPCTVGIRQLLAEGDSLCASTCGKWREGRQAPVLRERNLQPGPGQGWEGLAGFPGRGRGDLAAERRGEGKAASPKQARKCLERRRGQLHTGL